MISILGISGSLRDSSYNTGLLRAAKDLALDDIDITIFDIGDIPLYNDDLGGEVSAVERFKQAVADSDGVLIATPEYNYGIPGVLKNALDWASRPAYKSVFAKKPTATMGAAASPVGTARAQAQLKQVLLGMLSLVYPAPELTVGTASDKFNGAGQLQDERIREQLRRLVAGFSNFASAQGQSRQKVPT
ncbi:MAG: NAD(P)H-dependent oxidoreductase [Myxococcales bacterium]|nr:NAD(P)H-dependent oxidoreductase [Myxococcales bacterium]